MKPFKSFIAISICLILVTSYVFTDSILESIKVYRNQITLKVNGTKIAADNFTLNNVTYVPLRAVSDMLGTPLLYDDKTKTASLGASSSEPSNQGLIVKTLPSPVDPYNPIIDLKSIGLSGDIIDGFMFESNGKVIEKPIAFSESSISINSTDSIYGVNILDFNTQYTLKLFTTDNKRYRINFKSGSLASLKDTGERRIVYVPAMPEKGFQWPYYIVIPSNEYLSENKNQKKYLMVDTTNSGVDSSLAECAKKTFDSIEAKNQISMWAAEKLSVPFLMPVFPRPDVSYNEKNEWNSFYTHALDRDTATLHLKMKDRLLGSILTTEFLKRNYEIDMFKNLDRQLAAMTDHAIAYLNQYNHNVQPQKVFLYGYSASGTFTDRFATLNPDRVKAIASGGTLDDMILPLGQYKGKNLIFPIGTYDYKDITGRAFDLAAHNSMARLIFMGEDDDNNVVPYSDCYGDTERNIITSLWGIDVLPRAKSLIQLYGESGGKGMFILDVGIKHGSSVEMNDYVLEFFKANRGPDQPTYPTPKNAKQLKYAYFK